MSQNYIDYIAQDRRLVILRLLNEAGGTANESVLHTGLEMYGFRHMPRDTVRADIRFLLDAGLLVDEWLGEVQICTVTKRGINVAEGRIVVPGVKKPSIGV